MPYSVRMVKRASIGIIIWALLVGSLAGCGSSDTQVVSVGEPIEPDPMLVEVVETESEEVPIITPEPLPTPEPVPEPQPVEIEEEIEIPCCERWSPQWSPDSQYVAYVFENRTNSAPEWECYPQEDFVGTSIEGLGTCALSGQIANRTLEIRVLPFDEKSGKDFYYQPGTRGYSLTEPLFSRRWLGSSFTIRDLLWSPDGKRFAYTESCTDFCYGSMWWHTAVRVFTPAQFNAEGEKVTERKFRYVDTETDCPDNADRCSYESRFPLWTGDGQHLVFTIGNAAMFGRAGGSGGGGLLNIVDADGSNARLLPLPAGEPIALAASPDGQYIAGISDAGMFVMNIDSSDVRIFENNDDTIIEDIPATWSIDGTKIIFNRITQPEDETQDSERTVMVMNVDGSDMRQITEEEFFIYQTNISPDRTTIAYTDVVDGSREIFLVDANGENRRQLTFQPN